MAEEMIGIRVDPDLKEKIRIKMREENYHNMSDWIRDAILDRLDPRHGIERTKLHLLELIHSDTDVRGLLKL